MPVDFTLPPDTRAVGTGNPPQDMDNVVDALTAMGTGLNVLNAAYAGGADPTGAADSAAAFSACIAAAIAANGAEVVIPPGSYKLNSGIAITGPVKIRGLGSQRNTGGSLIPAVTLNCPASASMFTFPYQGYLWEGLEVGNLAISYTGTADVFHQMNFKAGWFHDLNITISGSGSSAFQTSGSVSVLNCEWERVFITTTNATRTVPMITLSSVTSGSVSNNTFWKCFFNNAGFDNTQYMIYIDCAAGAGAYHYMETFRDCWFESCYGGCIKSLSGMAVLIDGCTVWDIFGGSGGTVGNSLYYIGAYPSTGQGSQQSRITGCSRNRNGPNGTTTWDIYCEATTCGTLIEGYSVRADTASTATHAYFNLNSHPDVQLIGNTSPQGAAVNGNSTTVVTSPSFSTSVLGAGAAPGASALEIASATGWTPPDSGYLAWNFDPSIFIPNTTGNVLTAGTIFLNRVNIRRAMSITNVAIFLTALGTTLTPGQNFAGLYDSSGNRIAVTADQTSTGSNWGTTGLKTMALAGGPFAVQAGFYWVALLSNGATGISAARAQNTSANIANVGTSAAQSRWATNGTGTALPATITPSGNTQGNVSFWVGLS